MCGYEDLRQPAGVLAGSEPPANLEAGDAREHPVEDDKVRRVLRQAKFRLVAPLNALNNIALRLEIVGEQEREVRVVLNDENARLPAWTGDILASTWEAISDLARPCVAPICSGRAGVLRPPFFMVTRSADFCAVTSAQIVPSADRASFAPPSPAGLFFVRSLLADSSQSNASAG